MLCLFSLDSKVYQLYVYIYPHFFGFVSHLGHHRAMSRVCSPVDSHCFALCSVSPSCLTLCGTMDCSPPGSSVHLIFQTRILGWLLPFPTPGDLPNPGLEPESLASPAVAGGFFTTNATWEFLTSYLFYTQWCVYVNPSLPVHPFPPWFPYICSPRLCLYFQVLRISSHVCSVLAGSSPHAEQAVNTQQWKISTKTQPGNIAEWPPAFREVEAESGKAP